MCGDALRRGGFSPAYCILGCLCFSIIGLIIWNIFLTVDVVDLENNNSGGGGGTLSPTPGPTPLGATIAPTPATVVVLRAIDEEINVVNVEQPVQTNEFAFLRAALLDNKKQQFAVDDPPASDSTNDGSDSGGDDDEEYSEWAADAPVITKAPKTKVTRTKFRADVPVLVSDSDIDDDDNNSSSDSDSAGGTTATTLAPTPAATIAPTPRTVVAKRDQDAAEIQLARGAIKTGNKFVEEKAKQHHDNVKTTPKNHGEQQQQQQPGRVLSMAERRQMLIDLQKHARG